MLVSRKASGAPQALMRYYLICTLCHVAVSQRLVRQQANRELILALAHPPPHCVVRRGANISASRAGWGLITCVFPPVKAQPETQVYPKVTQSGRVRHHHGAAAQGSE